MEVVIGEENRRNCVKRVVLLSGKATAAALMLVSSMAWAQSFSFEIGNPVAAQDFQLKSALFVFRAVGCPDPSKADISATAEGLVGGMRRSLPIAVHASSRPGVYAVQRQWNAGDWVVVLKGSCGEAHAGAIVPVSRSAFVRDAVKLYPRSPAAAEIEAALRAIPEGGYQ